MCIRVWLAIHYQLLYDCTQRLGRELAQPRAVQKARSRGWIESGFEALHRLIESHGGAFSVGDEVSLADVCLVPQLYNARRFGVELSDYPRLLEIESRLSVLPAFIQAHPDQQPDAV